MVSGDLPELSELTLDELEGSDVTTLWEPVWTEHPSVKDRQAWERALRGSEAPSTPNPRPAGEGH